MKRPMRDRMASSKEIHRVLVGFGSAGSGMESLDLAGELAKALGAELAGLFVEEELIYRISELPTFSAIDARGQVMRNLNRASINQVIATHAQACLRALSQRAEESQLQWSYEVERGEALDIIGARVRGDEILLITGTARSTTPRAKMELVTQVKTAPRADLIVPDHLRRRKGPIAVLHPEDDGHTHLAMTLAASLGERVVAVAPGHQGQFQSGMPRGRFSHPAQIQSILGRVQPWLLVANHSDSIFADAGKAGELLRSVGAPILLVNS